MVEEVDKIEISGEKVVLMYVCMCMCTYVFMVCRYVSRKISM